MICHFGVASQLFACCGEQDGHVGNVPDMRAARASSEKADSAATLIGDAVGPNFVPGASRAILEDFGVGLATQRSDLDFDLDSIGAS